MKEFHTANGKEVVYIQRQDLIYLNNINIQIPTSIYAKILNNIFAFDDYNRHDYLKFEEQDEIKFFKELNCIIDCDLYKNMTINQLKEEWSKIYNKSNELAESWELMSDEEKVKNKRMVQDYDNLNQILDYIAMLFVSKKEKKPMPGPYFVGQI